MKTWTEKEIEEMATEYALDHDILDDEFGYGFIEGFKKALELNNLNNETKKENETNKKTS